MKQTIFDWFYHWVNCDDCGLFRECGEFGKSKDDSDNKFYCRECYSNSEKLDLLRVCNRNRLPKCKQCKGKIYRSPSGKYHHYYHIEGELHEVVN